MQGGFGMQGMNPFVTLMARGLEVGAGSDSPITPLDPMYGLWALETHHDPSQRLSREDGVRLYTQGSARLAHLEEKKGQLTIRVNQLRPRATPQMSLKVYSIRVNIEIAAKISSTLPVTPSAPLRVF